MNKRQTLIAHPSPATRSWLAKGLLTMGGSAREVGVGWEVLWHLAEEPFDLVVADSRLPGLPGTNVLAMVRTAGLRVPFLLIEPFPSRATRALVKRVGDAEIIDDWTDVQAVRAACRRLVDASSAHPDDDRQRLAMRELLLGNA